jgi:tRNA 2-thiouridine synthesizing protein A
MSDQAEGPCLDARFLPPPEPFVQAMALLDTLAPGERMTLLLFREPHPLYRVLLQDGHTYRARCLPDGTVEIVIQRATA